MNAGDSRLMHHEMAPSRTYDDYVEIKFLERTCLSLQGNEFNNNNNNNKKFIFIFICS